jgi:hypothetical protein
MSYALSALSLISRAVIAPRLNPPAVSSIDRASALPAKAKRTP